jgi:hypothetical protein
MAQLLEDYCTRNHLTLTPDALTIAADALTIAGDANRDPLEAVAAINPTDPATMLDYIHLLLALDYPQRPDGTVWPPLAAELLIPLNAKFQALLVCHINAPSVTGLLKSLCCPQYITGVLRLLEEIWSLRAYAIYFYYLSQALQGLSWTLETQRPGPLEQHNTIRDVVRQIVGLAYAKNFMPLTWTFEEFTRLEKRPEERYLLMAVQLIRELAQPAQLLTDRRLGLQRCPPLLLVVPNEESYYSPYQMDILLATVDLTTAKLEDWVYYTPTPADGTIFAKCRNPQRPTRSAIQLWRLSEELMFLSQMDSKFMMLMLAEARTNYHAELFLANLMLSNKLKVNREAWLKLPALPQLVRDALTRD